MTFFAGGMLLASQKPAGKPLPSAVGVGTGGLGTAVAGVEAVLCELLEPPQPARAITLALNANANRAIVVNWEPLLVPSS